MNGWRGIIAALAVSTAIVPSAVAVGSGASEGPTVRPYLAIDGREVEPGPCHMERSERDATVQLTAPRRAVYRFGVSIEAERIAPLAPGMPACTAASLKGTIVRRYPYDWTHVGQGNVLRQPRLVMPGVEVGGRIYLVDTHELTAISLEPAPGGKLRALLLLHRFYNDGADAATADLSLEAGERRRLRMLVFDDVASVNRARFGVAPAMPETRMAPIFYKRWANEYLTLEKYEEVARRAEGIFDWILVREAGHRAEIPPIFHSHGLKAICYQYFGGLRRGSPQVTPRLQAELGMKDRHGADYAAPVSPGGNWLLADIRQAKIRARFVAAARQAVRAGFDGVYLDGYAFWRDRTGRVGGDAPDAEHSLAYARWKLLCEIRAATGAVNPESKLGVLGNQYYDTLGVADYIVKERMYWNWDGDKPAEFDQRRTFVGPNLDLDFEDHEAPFAANNIVYGVKGYAPMAVQSARHFIRRPSGSFYFTPNDFYPERLDQWLDALVAIASRDDLYITDIEPGDARVHFEGLSTIRASKRCTVTFSKPIRVAPLRGAAGRPTTQLPMEPGIRYSVHP